MNGQGNLDGPAIAVAELLLPTCVELADSRTTPLMVWIAFITFGGLALATGAAVIAKQSLIEDAQSATKGYF
ncbi:hypothetical protein [Methylobacterium thuringiense]|nr:hypothetical protein [Methylobacterium thuringiense]